MHICNPANSTTQCHTPTLNGLESIKMASVEVFFDYSSPWTYLAFSQLRSLQQRYPAAHFIFRPVRTPPLFQALAAGGLPRP